MVGLPKYLVYFKNHLFLLFLGIFLVPVSCSLSDVESLEDYSANVEKIASLIEAEDYQVAEDLIINLIKKTSNVNYVTILHDFYKEHPTQITSDLSTIYEEYLDKHESVDVYTFLADMYIDTERYIEAQDAIARGKVLSSYDVRFSFLSAKLNYESGDIPKAIESYLGMDKYYDDLIVSYIELGKIFLEFDQIVKATKYFSKAYLLTEKNSYNYNLARYYLDYITRFEKVKQ